MLFIAFKFTLSLSVQNVKREGLIRTNIIHVSKMSSNYFPSKNVNYVPYLNTIIWKELEKLINANLLSKQSPRLSSTRISRHGQRLNFRRLCRREGERKKIRRKKLARHNNRFELVAHYRPIIVSRGYNRMSVTIAITVGVYRQFRSMKNEA